MKRAYWAGAVLVLGFLVLGLSTFSRSMTPYVSFAEAKSRAAHGPGDGRPREGHVALRHGIEDTLLHAPRPEDATSRFRSPTRT